jgi:hypothetical protein
MFGQLGQIAKKQILGSQYIIRSVGLFVENVVCTILETVGLGVAGYVIKDFLPGYWLDVFLVDIGFSVLYILFGSFWFRLYFHQIFEDPCQRLGRKIMGLDIQDRFAFLKLKYTLLILGSIVILFGIQNIQDLKFMIRIMVFETLMIQGCVDIWREKGNQIVEFVEEYVDPPQQTRLLTHEDCIAKKYIPISPISQTLTKQLIEQQCKTNPLLNIQVRETQTQTLNGKLQKIYKKIHKNQKRENKQIGNPNKKIQNSNTEICIKTYDLKTQQIQQLQEFQQLQESQQPQEIQNLIQIQPNYIQVIQSTQEEQNHDDNTQDLDWDFD